MIPSRPLTTGAAGPGDVSGTHLRRAAPAPLRLGCMNLRRAGAVAALLGLAAATGCGIGRAEHGDTVSYDVGDPVTALEVGTDAGSIRIVGSDRQGVHVTENLSWGGDRRPETRHAVRDGALVLDHTCPGGWGGLLHCDVSYTIEIPRGLRVRAGTDSGQLTLRGLAGAVDASSDSGRIEATELTGKNVLAGTDSGAVTVSFTAPPDKVEVRSDSGTATVRVPDGPYAVSVTTDSGSKRVGVPHQAGAPRTITVTTDSGAAEVLPS